jgi:hypothetical protein
MGLSDKQRTELIAVAESWYKTPYWACSCKKGCGVDCGQLIKGVYIEAGPKFNDGIPTPEHYSVQEAQHRKETAYVPIVEKYMREIPELEVKPGDVVLYRMYRGKAFAHAAIIKTWPTFVIHALPRHGVQAGHGGKTQFSQNHMLAHLEKKFYTLKDEFVGDEK